MILLSVLVLKKGANMGLKVLYIAGTLVLIALLMFFFEKPVNGAGIDYFSANVSLKKQRKYVFGVSHYISCVYGNYCRSVISGDFKKLRKIDTYRHRCSHFAMINLHLLICLKFANSALPKDLVENQSIMATLLLAEILIPLGLAACTFTSALSSIMVGILAHCKLWL